MNLYKDLLALDKEENERRILAEQAIQKEEDAKDALREQRYAALNARKVKQESFLNFKSDVKEFLLTESLKRIYVGSLKNHSNREISICESLLKNYIKDKGAEDIILNWGNTAFLEHMKTTINKYTKIITEEAKEKEKQGEDENTARTIDPKHLDEFFKELDDSSETAEDAAAFIQMRVANAEEEFVNRAERDKAEIKQIIDDTAARVGAVKPETFDDSTDEVPNDETNGEGEDTTAEDTTTEMNDSNAEEAPMQNTPEDEEDTATIEAESFLFGNLDDFVLEGMIDDAKNNIKNAGNAVKKTASGVAKKVNKAVSGAGKKLDKAGKAVKDTAEDIAETPGKVKEKAGDIVDSAKKAINKESYFYNNENLTDKQKMYVEMAQEKIRKINARPKSTFGNMVQRISEAALKNPALRESYSLSNGRLDIDAVVETARCMYGMLEMVNTLRIEVIDEEYIQQTLDSIC